MNNTWDDVTSFENRKLEISSNPASLAVFLVPQNPRFSVLGIFRYSCGGLSLVPNHSRLLVPIGNSCLDVNSLVKSLIVIKALMKGQCCR